MASPAAKSYTHDDNVINFFLRGNPGFIGSPVAVYAGLFLTNPANPGDAGTEMAGDTYARVPVTFSDPSGTGVTTNSAPVTFAMAGALWGTVEGVGIYDQAVGGNLLYFGALSTPKSVTTGDTASFAISALTIQEQ